MYQENTGFTLPEIRQRIGTLRRHLTSDWTRRAEGAGVSSPILPFLHGQGLSPFTALMSFSRTLGAAEQANNFARKFRDLIGPASHATLFEMEVAEILHRADWWIDFPIAVASPTADIHAHKNAVCIGIECKRLLTARAETWAQALSAAVIGTIGAESALDHAGIDVVFDPSIADLSFEGRDAWNHGIVDEIRERIATVVQELTRSGTTTARVRIDGVGEVIFAPSHTSLRGSVGGIPLSAQTRVRRIVTNAVLDARAQLQDVPLGVVAIQALFPPPFAMLDLVLRGMLRSDSEVLGNIGIVTVLPPVVLFAKIEPLVWENPVLQGRRDLQLVVADVRSALSRGALIPASS